jgi:glycosyltransferase involved in cell wall biosynthesis
MKVLMFAHRLEVGGTQWNAIELAEALVRLHGMDVQLFATPGPMAALARHKGLRLLPAPDAAVHPSPARVRALRDLVRRDPPDVVHAWDWWQCIDACCALRMGRRVPLVVSDMMMDLARVLPCHLPTTFGTPEMADRARSAGRSRVRVLLPPVDVDANAPGAVDPLAFRRAHGIAHDMPLLVTVSRLSDWMKSDSLVRSVQAVARLGQRHRLCLAIVGNGQARPRLELLAGEVNRALGRRAVIVAGALLDPRPAYAAADIVLGMGGSALRGMAFRKPVVVVGEGGFCELMEPASAPQFLYSGYFGRGCGAPDDTRLDGLIEGLLTDRVRRESIADFARRHVEQHHALPAVAAALASFYDDALARPVPGPTAAWDALRTLAVYLRERRFLCRSRDRRPSDELAILPAAEGAAASWPPRGPLP